LTGQQTLFTWRDRDAAFASRDAALDRVTAPVAWTERALAAVAVCAQRYPAGFTTDEVWDLVGSPPEPRAMGAVMQAAARGGVILATTQYRPSTRTECHARPVRVWVAA
jgi:alkylhydroperoxidase family enzyme